MMDLLVAVAFVAVIYAFAAWLLVRGGSARSAPRPGRRDRGGRL